MTDAIVWRMERDLCAPDHHPAAELLASALTAAHANADHLFGALDFEPEWWTNPHARYGFESPERLVQEFKDWSSLLKLYRFEVKAYRVPEGHWARSQSGQVAYDVRHATEVDAESVMHERW